MLPWSLKVGLQRARRVLAKRLATSQTTRQLKALGDLDRPLFVIVMPGGLHIARLALERIPPSIPAVVVLNGTDAWENRWAARHLRAVAHLRIAHVLEHSDVLDILLNGYSGDFGILDYDCFVMDTTLFQDMRQVSPDAAMRAVFVRPNDSLGIDVPETFFLFFNCTLLNDLRSRYGVDCAQLRWHALPEAARAPLSTLGLDAEHPPEEHKPYFDTLRALMMLAAAEGRPTHFVRRLPATPRPSDAIFHVGGISNPNSVAGVWALRGSYFWRRLLEIQGDDGLRQHYEARYGAVSAKDLLTNNPETSMQIDREFLDFCEAIMVRRAAA